MMNVVNVSGCGGELVEEWVPVVEDATGRRRLQLGSSSSTTLINWSNIVGKKAPN